MRQELAWCCSRKMSERRRGQCPTVGQRPRSGKWFLLHVVQLVCVRPALVDAVLQAWARRWSVAAPQSWAFAAGQGPNEMNDGGGHWQPVAEAGADRGAMMQPCDEPRRSRQPDRTGQGSQAMADTLSILGVYRDNAKTWFVAVLIFPGVNSRPVSWRTSRKEKTRDMRKLSHLLVSV